MGETFGERQYGNQIRHLRKAKGLTQTQLAQRIGISLNSVQRYEKNERQPSIDLLFKIANALGVTFLDLVLGDEKEQFLADMSPREREKDEERRRKLYWDRMETIYVNLSGLSGGTFAEVFRQCFPQLNEQGQERLMVYLQDLVKIEDYHQEPLPKPKDKGPGRVAPFANSDPQPPKSVSQDPGKEE